MDKIGILTYYYKSTNYGGNLQAYALAKYLCDQGFLAEQICFDANQGQGRGASLFARLRTLYHRIRRKLNRHSKKSKKLIDERQKSFYNFNRNKIPHSNQVYTRDSICKSINEYSVFIAGSDQVWNPCWYVSAYFLDFVPSGMKKVSYATSFGVSEFTDTQRTLIKSHLASFDAISLREHSVLEEANVFPSLPTVVLDPTLLLSKGDWEQVVGEPMVSEDYVFCYFFGKNTDSRRLAREYADCYGLKLISIPHLNGLCKEDEGFSDIEYPYASPEEFLSLIKNAKCIFTDSFHATVFSHLFEKNFFVFKREASDNMSSRIHSITHLLGTEERFCYTEEQTNLKYIEGIADTDYVSVMKKLEHERERSIKFLHEALFGVTKGEKV